MAQNGLNNPNLSVGIIKEILTLILGENAPTEMIDEALAKQQELIAQEQSAQEAQDEQVNQDDLEIQALLNGGV